MKVIVIEPNKKPEVREIKGDYKSVRQIIGGCLQAIPFMEGACAIMDEDAKVNGKPFVHNYFATILCQRALATIGKTMLPDDVIVNTLVIIGGPDDEGDWQEVPQNVIDFVGETEKLFKTLF